MEKKLTRDKANQKIAGVCAGIAKYFDVDATIIRLIWVVVTLAGGAGILLYVIAALLMPEETETFRDKENFDERDTFED